MKNHSKCSLLGLLFTLLMLTIVSRAHGDIEPNRVAEGGFYGYVKDNGGNPISGAIVKADDYQATTDVNGYYEIFIGKPFCTQLTAGKDNFFTQVGLYRGMAYTS